MVLLSLYTSLIKNLHSLLAKVFLRTSCSPIQAIDAKLTGMFKWFHK